jgi:hypothetical protein
MDASVQNTESGLRIKFGAPICPILHDLYLVSVEGRIAVVFDGSKKLDEIYLDLDLKKVLCRCRDLITKVEFVVDLPLELGIFQQFF